jgi:hypothetical protein
MRNAYKILAKKPEGKISCGRPRYKWEDNIRMDFREIGLEIGNWILLAQDRDSWWALVNMIMNLRFPLKMGNFVTS